MPPPTATRAPIRWAACSNEFLANNYATPVSDLADPAAGRDEPDHDRRRSQQMFVSGADVKATLDDAAQRLKEVMNK